MPSFTRTVELPVSAERAFAWHERRAAFDRLKPPWQSIQVDQQEGIHDGDRLTMRIGVGPLRIKWVARHEDYSTGEQFRDIQESGPFAKWEHTHRFIAIDEHHSTLEDAIEYQLPGGSLGRILGGTKMNQTLDHMFTYRHATTAGDLAMHAQYETAGLKRVAITGATGTVGKALTSYLEAGGVECLPISRRSDAKYITWDPAEGTIERERLERVDAVIHLAGEGIADKRWSAKQKQRIRDSRVNGTRLIAETIAALDAKPKVLVSASAIGFYGARGDETIDESSAPGEGFLAEVCQEWETATAAAEAAGVRVVHARLGIILSPDGGALAKMLTPAKFCGGKLGSGKQYMSWVDIDDVIGSLHHAAATDSIHGPMNVTAPNPVTNKEFTQVLGKVIGRPPLFPAPGFALKLALGQMAEMLLTGARVMPKRLEETEYAFRYGDLEASLRHLLGK